MPRPFRLPLPALAAALTLTLLGSGGAWGEVQAPHGPAPDAGIGVASAQAPAADTLRRTRFAALVGAAGFREGPAHIYGGLEGGAVGARWGGIGLGQGGGGGGITSFFVAAGPALRLARRERLDLAAFAGPGVYGEIVPAGFRRWTRVATGGLSARAPVGGVLLAVNVSGFRGIYTGVDFQESLRVRGIRTSVGIGWGWGF